MAGKDKRVVVSINERKFLNAVNYLEPAAKEVWDMVGMDITTSALLYLAAKAVMKDTTLTDSRKLLILSRGKEKLDLFAQIIDRHIKEHSANNGPSSK